ncbi:MAG: DPP IV N-terminal domain-containing protein [Chloroflexota bacterium]
MLRKVVLLSVLVVMLVAAASAFGRSKGHIASVVAGPEVGGKIAYTRNGGLWVYSGGEQHQLTAGPKDHLDKRDAAPSFSPNGTQIVYSRIDEGFSDLYLLDLANPSSPIALTDHRPNVEVGQVEIPGVTDGYNTLALWANFPAWSPVGDEIAYTSDVGYEYPALWSIAPNGVKNGKLAGGLDYSQQTIEHPTWSPDGKKIAVANYTGTTGHIAQIWVYNLTTQEWRAITDAKEGAYDPAWSPDGRWIAFTMREEGVHNIYVVSTDSSTWTDTYPTPVQLTRDGADRGARSPAWSTDSSSLAYISLKGVSFDLYAADFTVDAADNPSLEQSQQLTDNATIDATSGLSWGK